VEGDSEVMLMNIFEKARANAPSILIFDDLNSVASSRKGEIGSKFSEIIIINNMYLWS
jgi:SpoVK/Ycf46/Vps4 family AAA+-type ATPase